MPAMTIIGGEGYRWRGRSIRTIHKDNSTCVTMPRKDSIVMAPCDVESGAQYKVTMVASKNSGNGALLINFFGGQTCDGEHIGVNILSANMQEYTVAVTAPVFPSHTPIYFRIWRTEDATGNVFIKGIRFSVIGSDVNIKREPKLAPLHAVKNKPPKQNPKKEIKPETKPVSENNIMKFKPYEKDIGATSAAQSVLIIKAEDVPKVSIITPTRDGLELLKKCYIAINANTSYPNWEWIVGDSASTDGTVAYLKSLNDSRIKIVERNSTEGSFSSINNELANFANGEYLLFLNNDTEPQPFWLFEMVSKIHRNQDIGIVGARLIYSKDKIQHAGIAFIPQGPANIGKAVLGSFPQGFAAQDRFFQAVTGACFIIRQKDFRLIGGFDPIYYFCYEDVDLCLKVRKQLNKKVLYAANAIVIHSESITQNKFKTSGEKQQIGIKAFKERWMSEVEIDFPLYQRDSNKGRMKVDISFVTCVNNVEQYRNLVIGSLFKSGTNKYYEIIPVLNFGNPYSAAKALNAGLDLARGEIVVFCHQDIVFYKEWIDMLYERIAEIEKQTTKWGVLGTAGISENDNTTGVVHNMRGTFQWTSTIRAKFHSVQTVDEHCMVIRKSSGLRFDDVVFDGFHCYGPDLCLSAISKGLTNFGILCPLVHDSMSGSIVSGKKEFMRLLNALAQKWRPAFPIIRTTTSLIRKKSIQTFIRFRNA